jgi:hypothetical protein
MTHQDNRGKNENMNTDAPVDESNQDLDPPKVLISYSHDSPEHSKAILDLANQLRSDGIDVIIDQFEPHPPEGWPQWMQRRIEKSQFVLMVFTERYYLRCRGEEKTGVGKGVTWESIIIDTELYESQHDNKKFVPIVLRTTDEQWITTRMRSYTRYVLSDYSLDHPGGYQNLYRYLTDQPANTPRPLGRRKKLEALMPQTLDSVNRNVATKEITSEPKGPPPPDPSINLKIVVMCLLATVLLSFPIWVVNQPARSPAVLQQWNLEEDLATQVAADLHDNKSVAKSQLYIGKRGKFKFALTSTAAKDFIGRSFNLPFNTDPTSITIEVNIVGQFDTDKFEAFDGSVVNVKGTVSKIEKVSDVRATIYLEQAEFTDLPTKQ